MCALFCFFCLAGRASVLNDPAMGMSDDSSSNPFTNGTTLTPGSGGGGIFPFYNPTGMTIVQMQFTVQLLPDLDTGTVDGDFSCNNGSTPGAPNPFFLFCSVNYAPSDGILLITFSGTNSSDPGIAPLLPTCDNDPNSPDSTTPVDCTSQGHFLITLNDDFTNSGDSGGWTSTTPGGAALFGDGVTPQIDTVSFETSASVPEPITGLSTGAALLALAGWRRKRRRVHP